VIYVSATAATAFTWNLASFTICRMLTGAGIGGEYAAINSAVDELMPARLRGRVDLWINGTFWVGIILGSLVSTQLLAHDLIAGVSGWRIAFCSGLPIAVVVWFARRVLPESPRWLIAHGDTQGAQESIAHIQAAVLQADLPDISKPVGGAATRPQRINLQVLWSARFRKRTFLCLVLMIAQAFFYNSVFFSLSLVLLRFYSATNAQVSLCFSSIAVANVLGPFLLGTFFDSIGRRKMIAITYGFTGIFLTVSSVLFLNRAISFRSQVALWALSFFFASTAASSAYLTVSEAFPQQIRATAIAVFYAFGTLLGGVSGPLIFGRIIGSGQRSALFSGYLFGAIGMIVAGCVALNWGLDAERKSLEELAGT
jgi:MFS family permease